MVIMMMMVMVTMMMAMMVMMMMMMVMMMMMCVTLGGNAGDGGRLASTHPETGRYKEGVCHDGHHVEGGDGDDDGDDANCAEKLIKRLKDTNKPLIF